MILPLRRRRDRPRIAYIQQLRPKHPLRTPNRSGTAIMRVATYTAVGRIVHF